MRGMHGLDVLARLRELDPEAKVVVISADVQTSSRDLVREAGAAGFLNKPVNPAEVLDAVSRVTRGERPPWN
jgi:two-component system, chemotaxis family, chemotaxis protein CheY